MKRSDSDEKKKKPMQNITINLPEIYDVNIQKLIKMGLLSSRSEAIRTAVREYLQKEYSVTLDLLDFFDNKE
ncbi:MAG: ribbon-helix-helix protein, CopG family [Candidatus Lokiarchaeota archaeon]|nr:ribbon-helix-helix protein, CopG family [Candidatus Lokiarchaeota archaeon]MBD3199097.1 ribbon-helix-helix protein, CopG family [Candidatus Lokiarchaeota archaeon]